MSNFKVLTKGDYLEWNELCNGCLSNDIYFSPGYHETCALIMDGTPHCFVYFQDENNYVLYPFMLRKINDNSLFHSLGKEYFDIISAYGYGGPLVKGTVSMNDFKTEFEAFCQERQIVSEFMRFHPLLANEKFFSENAKVSILNWNETVFVDLNQPIEIIEAGYAGSNKRNIKKAINNGLVFKIHQVNEENMMTFFNLYNKTMERLGTTTFYFFKKEYFMSLIHELKTHLWLFSIMNNQEENLSMGLFFGFNGFFHYHLGCSDQAHLDLRPNNLLFYYSIQWAKTNGYKIFHLGGGRNRDDSLFHFKSLFSSLHVPFYIGKVIHNKQVYDELTRMRMVYNQENSINLDPNYFPAYR